MPHARITEVQELRVANDCWLLRRFGRSLQRSGERLFEKTRGGRGSRRIRRCEVDISQRLREGVEVVSSRRKLAGDQQTSNRESDGNPHPRLIGGINKKLQEGIPRRRTLVLPRW